MASKPLPPSAGSPPYSSSSVLPPLNTNLTNRKRSAADGTPAPTLKRRKGSQMSAVSLASNHPLRQTSFPPDEAHGTPLSARSPSVDIETASQFSGSVASSAMPFKKKRGRKSKAEMARQQTPSVVGGSLRGGKVGAGQKSVLGGEGDGDEEDEEDDVPVAAGTAATTETKQSDRDEDKKLKAAMSNYLDKEQFDRYSAFRGAKLPDASVRRLVNQTVSQSVPKDVITAAKVVGKDFLATVIAIALNVQKEWAKTDETEKGQPRWPGKVLSRGNPEVRAEYERQAEMYEFKPLPDGTEWRRDQAKYIRKEESMGPLLPDHIREAYRRYKRTLPNDTVGIQSLWHTQQGTGVERFPVKTGGRRIFR